MRKVFDFLSKGAVGIVWPVTSAIILAVMVRQGYIDGIAEWIVKFSDMNAESIKYSLTAASYIASVLLFSFVLSKGIIWIVRKVVDNSPSNQLKRMHDPIKIVYDRYSFLTDESNRITSEPRRLDFLEVTFNEKYADVAGRLEKICKIKMPQKKTIKFMGYILDPVRRGDVHRIRQISEQWDTYISKGFRE